MHGGRALRGDETVRGLRARAEAGSRRAAEALPLESQAEDATAGADGERLALVGFVGFILSLGQILEAVGRKRAARVDLRLKRARARAGVCDRLGRDRRSLHLSRHEDVADSLFFGARAKLPDRAVEDALRMLRAPGQVRIDRHREHGFGFGLRQERFLEFLEFTGHWVTRSKVSDLAVGPHDEVEDFAGPRVRRHTFHCSAVHFVGTDRRRAFPSRVLADQLVARGHQPVLPDQRDPSKCNERRAGNVRSSAGIDVVFVVADMFGLEGHDSRLLDEYFTKVLIDRKYVSRFVNGDAVLRLLLFMELFGSFDDRFRRQPVVCDPNRRSLPRSACRSQ